MDVAFWGAVNLIVKAVDTPDFSAVTDMSRMFYGATSANPDTSGWHTSGVTDMGYMFYGATSFDRDMGSWDVTALTEASGSGMSTGLPHAVPPPAAIYDRRRTITLQYQAFQKT